MLQPKRTKFRKQFKGRIHGVATKGGPTLNFGAFGLKALEPERVTARQIEAARRAITRHMKRAGRVWIRVFPDVPVSKKPTEVRMGKGKGTPEFWACRVKPGRIMFEIDGVPSDLAREALRLGAAKLPIRTRFVQRIAGLRGMDRTMKAGDVASDERRPARRRARHAEEGAVQPALPAGDRPAREHRRASARCAAISRA